MCTLIASPLLSEPIESEALMVAMDGLSDARVDTGVPTKADAHAAKDNKQSKNAQKNNREKV